MSLGYREKAIVFGGENNLVGIVCSGPSSTDPTSPAVIIPNAGVIHRVGPSRLGVQLSRELARLGLTSLRFDLSGIGDSARRSGNYSLDASIVKDIDDTMAYFGDSYGIGQFLFAGLCSGAREAFRTAHRDPRVIGAIMIDPIAFRTPRYYLHHYAGKLGRLESWSNVLRGRNHYLERVSEYLREELRSGGSTTEEPEAGPAGLPAWPTREQFADALDRVLSRRVQLLLVYTGGVDYSYAGQFAEAFPRAAESECMSVAHYPDADHILSRMDHRLALFARITEWLETCGFLDGPQPALADSLSEAHG